MVSTVEEAVSPIGQELSTLRTRVEVLENSIDFIRDPNDRALRRIAVLAIESKDPAVRIAVIGDRLRTNIPEVRFANVKHFCRREQPDRKKSEISNAAYVEFSDYYLREIALVKLMGKPPLNISGTKLDFKRALTKEACARNNVLKDVEKTLKAHPRTSGFTIKRELGPKDRGVTMNGVDPFSQTSSGPRSFQQPFADLKMPGRNGARRPYELGGRAVAGYGAVSKPSGPFVPLRLPLDRVSVTECAVAAPAARPHNDNLRACRRGARYRVASDRRRLSWRSRQEARDVAESQGCSGNIVDRNHIVSNEVSRIEFDNVINEFTGC